MGRDVANEQVDVMDVALHGQTLYLLPVAGVQHDPAPALQGAAATADAADVADIAAVALHTARSRAH